jgi:hypothetical protein
MALITEVSSNCTPTSRSSGSSPARPRRRARCSAPPRRAVLGRAAQSILFGVEAGSPVALAAAAVVLAAVTFGAA